jgi:fermentation-respiration switch protein FrsA (DUF1100 family)
MEDVAVHRFAIVPRPLMRVMLQTRFDSLSKIPRVPCPILLIHAHDDTTIPFSMCGRLAGAARSHVTCIASPDGGHSQILDDDHTRLLDAICQFAHQVVPLQ